MAIVGDILRSRVARSDLFGFRKMGIDVRLVGPPTLMPPGIEYWDVPVYNDLAALEDVDVIYLLRMQLERAKGKVPPVPSLREYSRVWGLSPYRVKPGQRVMHPGPINRGVELSADLADDERSLILAPGGIGPGRAHGHPLPVPGGQPDRGAGRTYRARDPRRWSVEVLDLRI